MPRSWRLAVLHLLVAALVAPGTSVLAQGRYSAMVVDGNTGDVLHARAIDEPRYPASLTKMMTIYLVFEAIEAGKLSFDTRLRTSVHAASTSPSKLDLAEGEQISVLDAVKALIAKSANDVAVVVAEHLAGSEEAFARLMTKKARELGMAGTTFRNPHGLPDSGQVSTARDMIALAQRLQNDFPQHYKHFSLRTFNYKGESHKNHNGLLFSFAGTDGIKTGYISSSGFNLVANVRRGEKHVIGVIFGGGSAGARNAQMRALLTNALGRASTTRKERPVLVARARPKTGALADAGAAGRKHAGDTPTPPVPRLAQRVQFAAADTSALPVVKLAEAAPAPALEARPASAPKAGTQAPSAAPPPAPAQPAEPLVEVAKVRVIKVAPRTETDDRKPATGPSAAAAPAAPPPAAPKTVPAKTPASAPDAARTTAAPLPAPASAAAASDSPAPKEPVAGAAPKNPPFRLKGPAGAPDAPSRASPQPLPPQAQPGAAASPEYHIQVGAFPSLADAERQIAAVRLRSGNLLEQAAPVTKALQKDGKTVFRARFSGFDQARANAVCTELKKVAVDCWVVKGP